MMSAMDVRRPYLRWTLPVLAIAAALSPSARAPAQAPPAGDVGIDEKLGGKVPLDISLNDEEGKPVTLGSLIDKPTILTLNYFACRGICTPLLNGLVETLNQLQLEPGKDFQVITVSFDPRDTPEIAFQKRLNYLRQMKRQFPPAAWRFLTGEAAATRRLTGAVGFKFRAEGNDFIHPGAIIVLSPRGEVTRYMYGISFLPADLQMAVEEAARGEARPTISKVLRFCFSYDPESRRYVFNMTRVAGGFILILAAGFVVFLLAKGRAGRAPKGSSS